MGKLSQEALEQQKRDIERLKNSPFGQLSKYERYIVMVLYYLKNHNIEPTIDNIHTKAITYMLEHNVKFDCECDLIKTLKKVAIESKKKGVWEVRDIYLSKPQD
ncbi:MAG: hypothetical protein SOW25_02325 [Helicobacter sp.]|nr:hypothetical protein [Helicobacteraceae bacterium]MDY3113146.1 hypothetical protein [Helicobacter sp.]